MSERFTLIGLGDSPMPEFSTTVRDAIAVHRVFAGGERHHMLVEGLLPCGYRWITIEPPIDNILAMLRAEPEPITVFASGDPFFYGFGATLQRAFPGASFVSYPWFHSLQRVAQLGLLPYQKMRHASLTGRSWKELDALLIAGAPLIGVLTDHRKTPAAIASRLIEYGFCKYSLIVGEALGGPEERVRRLSPEAAEKELFHQLNSVVLLADNPPERLFGISEDLFEGLHGRPGMITKMPVRMATLSRLNLLNARNFWDIGFCTGSVSIEAKLLVPELDVIAFERRPECADILECNCRRFRTPGISKVMGDFILQDHESFVKPFGSVDSVFIGGHGGRIDALFPVIDRWLSPGGRVVVNAVRETSLQAFRALFSGAGYNMSDDLRIVPGNHYPVTVATAEKPGKRS
ncbi:MAG: precorrin-6y C5,15-methyltransferase (decarboxylating) subunit CbiE [Chlorobiaceae bacterium]|jgi:precorrin-6Y C5,15-methyltransferase (decarboxylating)|nr:precorrin-6y C5,15-methyltransferase (decarboxylating) subunit CbiE [Chlorobiaceae bacterium]